mgnify:FL=1
MSDHSSGRSLGEICTDLALSRTTVYSILCNLESLGYIRKANDGRYFLGLRLYSLGMSAAYQVRKSDMMLPELTRLRDDLGQTVHVCSYSNNETICMEKLDGNGSIVFKSYIGERKPLHHSASGKAILAYLPQAEFEGYILWALSASIKDAKVTAQQLRECRQQVLSDGFSIDDEEGEAGVFCFGVPLFSSGGSLFGSVSVSIIKGSITMLEYNHFSKRILETGEIISRSLGYTGEYPNLLN